MIAIISMVLEFNYPRSTKINNLRSQFRMLTGKARLLQRIQASHSPAKPKFLRGRALSFPPGQCELHSGRGIWCGFFGGGFATRLFCALPFASQACGQLFHSMVAKKAGVWLQVTFVVLLLNWPAREISHWNGVTGNMLVPDMPGVAQHYQWSALEAPTLTSPWLRKVYAANGCWWKKWGRKRGAWWSSHGEPRIMIHWHNDVAEPRRFLPLLISILQYHNT